MLACLLLGWLACAALQERRGILFSFFPQRGQELVGDWRIASRFAVAWVLSVLRDWSCCALVGFSSRVMRARLPMEFKIHGWQSCELSGGPCASRAGSLPADPSSC